MADLTELDQYLTDHRRQFEEDWCQWLRIPSVSADRNHTGDCRLAADWAATHLSQLGLSVERIETSGHPIVYDESPPVPRAPTVLVYGHYDVQPAEPLAPWTTPPFEPTVRGGNLYARGATDDKGQLLTHVHSTRAWLETAGRLPVQLKFLIEGEEEVGSEGLHRLLEIAADKLACDVVVISDGSQFAPGQPAITYGLRGIAYFELRLHGPRNDLHSGSFGGGVTNPANVLARMLGSLVDDQGRIQVPGFYADVVPMTDGERARLAALPFDEPAFRAQVGVDGVTGEAGYTTLERRWARPSCDINGIWSGYQDEGAKTVLPSFAGAKFSFRLVPRQDPQQLAANLREMLAAICPPGIRMELVAMHGSPGVVVNLDSPHVQAASRAIQRGFGRAPVYIREGGSIPIVSAFHQHLGADSLLLGWGLDDDNAHGPNEKLCLADFHRGIRTSAYLWQELAVNGDGSRSGTL